LNFLHHSTEVSYLSYPSPEAQDTLSTLTPSQKFILSKIKARFFSNPLISESDLLLANDNYDFDPNILNNIDRFEVQTVGFLRIAILKKINGL
jgi:hypothetical protein